MGNILDAIKNLDDNSKKLLKMFSIGLVIFIVVIIIISIIVSIINRKTDYVEMESVMAKAAYDYYNDHKEELPSVEVKTQIISAQTLISSGYMKEISKYTKDESCTGNVVVSYVDGIDYDYQGFLECNSFSTELLVDRIKNKEQVVTQGNGLYQENDGTLRYRGEFVNNYLSIKDELYRIIKIDAENRIFIIPETVDDNKDEIRSLWDDRYNSVEDSSCGINDYTVSRIKENLDKLYKINKEKIPELTNKLVNYDVCIGKRGLSATANDGSIECSKKFNDQKMGLLPLYEYIRASIDTGCTSAASKECKNYNYLVMDENSWWTATAITEDTATTYYISSNGLIDKDKGFNYKPIRFVGALNDKTVYSSGKGTKEDPYVYR